MIITTGVENASSRRAVIKGMGKKSLPHALNPMVESRSADQALNRNPKGDPRDLALDGECQ